MPCLLFIDYLHNVHQMYRYSTIYSRLPLVRFELYKQYDSRHKFIRFP